MLMSILIASIIIGASMNDNSGYALEDADKLVAKAITDKDRQKEAKAIFKAADKDIKAFGKTHKSQFKEFTKEIKAGEFGTPKMESLLTASLQDRQSYQSKLVDYRLQLQELMTAEEWDAVIVKGVNLRDKEIKKLEKSKRKFDEKTEEKLAKVTDAIISNISDKTKQKAALDSFDKLQDHLWVLYLGIQQHNFRESSVLPRQDASKEDLEKMFEEFDNIRTDVYGSLIEFFEAIRENSPDDESYQNILDAFVKAI